jgi:hypothetical protein
MKRVVAHFIIFFCLSLFGRAAQSSMTSTKPVENPIKFKLFDPNSKSGDARHSLERQKRIRWKMDVEERIRIENDPAYALYLKELQSEEETYRKLGEQERRNRQKYEASQEGFRQIQVKERMKENYVKSSETNWLKKKKAKYDHIQWLKKDAKIAEQNRIQFVKMKLAEKKRDRERRIENKKKYFAYLKRIKEIESNQERLPANK